MSILVQGFLDGEGDYGMRDANGAPVTLRGVWLSDQPLDESEGAVGDVLLEVSMTEAVDLEEYEVLEDGKTYREWIMPAELVNTFRIREVDEDDVAADATGGV